MRQLTQAEWDQILPPQSRLEELIREAPDTFTPSFQQLYGGKDWQEYVSRMLYRELQRAFEASQSSIRGEICGILGIHDLVKAWNPR